MTRMPNNRYHRRHFIRNTPLSLTLSLSASFCLSLTFPPSLSLSLSLFLSKSPSLPLSVSLCLSVSLSPCLLPLTNSSLRVVIRCSQSFLVIISSCFYKIEESFLHNEKSVHERKFGLSFLGRQSKKKLILVHFS